MAVAPARTPTSREGGATGAPGSELAGVAGAILVAGGLDALQGAAIVAATPFAVLMVAICWCLYRALARDHPAVHGAEAS